MQLSQFIEALRSDLTAVAAVGDERTAQAAERISVVLEGSLALRLVDAFSAAAVELNAQIPNGHVEVRLAGRDPQLVFVEEDARAADAPTEDGATARITLRLSESLKDQVEVAAAAAGVSVNTWIVRALARTVTQPARRSRNRLTGFAES
ncbi:MAG: toxin-antitoxin system HicB family antitoxin [Gaiellaceae bacterium]